MTFPQIRTLGLKINFVWRDSNWVKIGKNWNWSWVKIGRNVENYSSSAFFFACLSNIILCDILLWNDVVYWGNRPPKGSIHVGWFIKRRPGNNMKAGHIKARKFIFWKGWIGGGELLPDTSLILSFLPRFWRGGVGRRRGQTSLCMPQLPRLQWGGAESKYTHQYWGDYGDSYKVGFEKRSSLNNVIGLRCSFDESHRQPIFLLGGIPALAELIQVTLPYILNQPNLPEKMVWRGWLVR